ncbi:ABC-F family ATP-binding cassette domain-containing protein [Aquipuribacter sp. MA13-6]|uniref:ABC-F family ATP-binding cassette domain-containing protein n=1 Tax=unclassified Aquipuribacter TaxID=2635084 RepID=UPI003EF057AC
MGHVDVVQVGYGLPDGRPLLSEVSFRVPEGVTTALVGPNGVGKTTLLRMVTGQLVPDTGSVVHSGGLGVMAQFVGRVGRGGGATAGGPGDGGAAGADGVVVPDADGVVTVERLLRSVAPPRVRAAGHAVDDTELALMDDDSEPAQLRYAQALADYGDAGGYELENTWDRCCLAALGVEWERARSRDVATLSGGEQKRLVLEALLRGPDEVLVLDEPDNYLDVPGKTWLEEQLRATAKAVLLVSHDRELLARGADRVVTLEPGAAGATAWVHGGGFGTWHAAREDRNARLEELGRRWEEEREKLVALVLRYKVKAAFNDGLASQYQAAQTRLRKFEEAGPPQALPQQQQVTMRLRGARTGKRAVVAEQLLLRAADGSPLVQPFDLEVWFGDRVAVLGSNGSGKSHLLRLLAAGGSDPDVEHRPVGSPQPPVRHDGAVRLGARVRPGWFAQTNDAPHLLGRTLLEVLHRGDSHRDGLPREPASRVLDRYGLAQAAEQRYDVLSGGQQARFQILLLELSGCTLLLLDEPTDNLDLDSAEALEHGLAGFEGTVLAVTHDRWFARGFDRFVVVGEDGYLREVPEPVWDSGRVGRAR